jgi:hypothetical protein
MPAGQPTKLLITKGQTLKWQYPRLPRILLYGVPNRNFRFGSI